MAAPSVGRRSCVGQRKAAALIYQSRRWIYGRVKVLLYDGFFSLPSSGRCSILCQFQKFLIILYYFFVLSYVKAG